MYKGEIPFFSNGSVPSYAYAPESGVTWKPNAIFEANLSIESFSRGRSAANFDVKNMQTGAKYTMFLTDFLALLKRHTLDHGETPRLKWQFTKRGQNYGVTLAD